MDSVHKGKTPEFTREYTANIKPQYPLPKKVGIENTSWSNKRMHGFKLNIYINNLKLDGMNVIK